MRQTIDGVAEPTSQDISPRRAVANNPRHLWWLFLVGFVTLTLCSPFIRTAFWLADEGILLNGAVRMLHGQVLYRDFFEFLPPGGFLITEAWLSIVGKSLVSVRILAILLITGIACFTYLANYRASKFGFLSALVPILWVVMSQGRMTLLSHHWITASFSMVTVWATLAYLDDPMQPLRWPLIAGLAAGVAAMVTPTMGALVMLIGLTVFLDFRQGWSSLLAYLGACLLVPTIAIVHLLLHGALTAAIDDVIIFPFFHYSSVQWAPWGFGISFHNFPFKFLYPALLFLVALDAIYNWRSRLNDKLFRTCMLYAAAGFALCFPRPDWFHIENAAPLALPLGTYVISRNWHRMGAVARYVISFAALSIVILPIVSFGLIVHKALHTEPILTPRGKVAFVDQPGIAHLVSAIMANPRNQSYFFYPNDAMLDFLTARENASKYEIFVPEYTLPPQYESACVSVMHSATWVVIDRSWNAKNWKIAYPAIKDTQPPGTLTFQHALSVGFQPVWYGGKFELLHRTASANPRLCSEIMK